jgi:hypothetical protein
MFWSIKVPFLTCHIFLGVALLGSVSFALSFTMMSAISAKANQNIALMAILSLPFIIPVLLLLIKLSQAALLTHMEVFPYRIFCFCLHWNPYDDRHGDLIISLSLARLKKNGTQHAAQTWIATCLPGYTKRQFAEIPVRTT